MARVRKVWVNSGARRAFGPGLRRTNTPSPEYNALRDALNTLGVRWRRGATFGGQKVNFYCAEWSLAVDIANPKRDSTARGRDHILKSQYGVRVLWVTEPEIRNDLGGLTASIRRFGARA